MSEITLLVKGMTCGGCKKSVENGVSSLNGVENVNVELETGKVEVGFNETIVNVDEIKSAIQSKGYFVEA
ncbi:MAG TPA: copper ion binding protein [Ureibacillus sp.]|nr:copper ion binding protein [Ureibacillus sp.]